MINKNNYIISMQQHYGGKLVDLDYYLKFIESNFQYIYIIHDKESDLHFHAILIGVSKSWNDLLKLFPTADIDIQKKSNAVNYKYLLHSDKKSISLGKTPYLPSDIHSNIDIDLFISSNSFDAYFYDILVDIYSNKYSSISDLIAVVDKRYLSKFMKRYFILKDLIEEINSQYCITNFDEVENETKQS